MTLSSVSSVEHDPVFDSTSVSGPAFCRFCARMAYLTPLSRRVVRRFSRRVCMRAHVGAMLVCLPSLRLSSSRASLVSRLVSRLSVVGSREEEFEKSCRVCYCNSFETRPWSCGPDRRTVACTRQKSSLGAGSLLPQLPSGLTT
jgi:hypothetical protein